MDFKARYTYDTKRDLLGRGGFARVYKAYDVLLERYVAVKVFTTHENDKYNVLEEIKKAIKLEHPSLLRYYDVAMIEGQNAFGEKETMQIGVMELANCGDLKTFTNQPYDNRILNGLLIQVLEGISYLHKKGIIHRDLKPQNILLVEDGGTIGAKISDFGISKNLVSSGASSSAVVGTIEYMAPEQFNPTKYGVNGKIGTNVDIWSFGILVFEVIMKRPLFGSRGQDTTAEQIMSSILAPKLPADVDQMPEPYQTIVKQCLVTDASNRIGAATQLIPYLREAAISGTPTMEYRIPLSSSAKQTGSQETLVMPRIEPTEPVGNGIQDSVGLEPPGSSAPARRRGKPMLLLILMLSLLVLGGAAYYYYSNAFQPKTAPNPAALYAQAMKNFNKDNTDFLVKLTQSANAGYDSANLSLASYYDSKNKFDSATLWLQPLVIHNNDKAIEQTAAIWAKSKDSAKTDSVGVYYKKCSAMGNPECQYQLGMLYYNGALGLSKDFNVAFNNFLLAAKQENAPAQCMLGNMYFSGDGVSKDDQEAFQWYIKSSGRGNVVATYAIGLFYADGIAVQKDKRVAEKYLRLAADGNNPAVKEAASKKLREITVNQ